MNATNIQSNLKQIERTFQVALFNETRELKANGFQFTGQPEPTRFHANGVVAVRYRTSRKLHLASVEIETKPEEVERLTKHPFNWRKGDGIAYRVTGFRSFGNFRSVLIPLDWADKFTPDRFA
jgi:hypothetical protein